MGLLDDLRSQTDDRKSDDAAEEARKKQLKDFYQKELHPRMTLAYNYLREFIEHLEFLEIEKRAIYPFLPQECTVSLRQHDYNLTIDSRTETRIIDLSFYCRFDEKVKFEIEGKENILRHSDFLDSYQVNYHRRDFKDDSWELLKAEFILEGAIPVHIALKGDIEKSNAKVILRNFNHPGLTEYTLSPHNLDKAFLDKLGKFILREETNLLELDISEVDKARLMLRVEQGKIRREQEMREAERIYEAEQKALAEQNKKSRLKQTVAENKEKLTGMFKKLKDQAGFNKPK